MNDPSSGAWLLLTASLSGRTASTGRVRLWRALKDLGVGNLRDGVSLLPASEAAREALTALVQEVRAEEGIAWLLELPTQPPELEQSLRGLFDRRPDYAEFTSNLAGLAGELPGLDEATARRRLRQLDRALAEIARIDFFPGPAQVQARASRDGVAAEIDRRFSPGEPRSAERPLPRLSPADYQGRTWATRRHLWVDRVASAWLIRRHIDPRARFLWLESPADCPADALGFDFDGATFSHVGQRVTFEVLSASFDLTATPGLARLAALVHYLDLGGPPVAEAPGFEAILAGLRAGCADDDALLAAATPVLDALERRFRQGGPVAIER
jgi:hypothetical protein